MKIFNMVIIPKKEYDGYQVLGNANKQLEINYRKRFAENLELAHDIEFSEKQLKRANEKIAELEKELATLKSGSVAAPTSEEKPAKPAKGKKRN